MSAFQHILDRLPYTGRFRFVDELRSLDEHGAVGTFFLAEDAWFYEDHFPGNPVTPGVILTEIMAQNGLVALGIFLLGDAAGPGQFPLLTSVELNFQKMVLPGTQLTIESKKIYFRFGKLRCFVEARNADGETVASGYFSGIMHVKR